MKKLIFLIVILALAAANAFAARIYPAEGRVVDEQGQAVEYATVVLLKGSDQVAGMATDDTGRFVLKVPSGEYTLSVQYLGFDPVVRQVRVEENNDLLLTLISDILDLSKIEAGQMDFNYSAVDLSEIFNNLQQVYKSRVKDGVDLVCHLPSVACVIHSEKNRLTQVLSNFLSNACKYTSEGSITMGYERIGAILRFYVADTGKGLAEENIPHVFERFAKFDSFVQGTGLGLSITKSIVEHYGGGIGVESKKGEGSTFYFTLPAGIEYKEYGKF